MEDKIIEGEEQLEEKQEAETLAAPEEGSENAIPNLTTEPVPTEEEKLDAGLEPATDLEPEPEPQPNPELPEPENNLEAEPAEPLPVAEPTAPAEPAGLAEPEIEKTFTQSQVNELIGKTRVDTRNKTFEYIYGRYGVNDENGLDELVGNAQRYDSLREEYDTNKANWKQEADTRNSELRDLSEKVALMESGIDRERYDDAKFILKGKGLDVTAENIASELASHPEWKKAEEIKKYVPKHETNPIGGISVLGNEPVAEDHGESEEDVAMNKYFKV